jgi:excinuclease ABC subunit C
MCYKNIYEFAYKKHIASLSTKWFTKQNMKNLLHVLGYSRINKDITFECNDISHLSWTHTVASRSVIENWKTANSKYKKFKIKNLEEWKIDDFDSMREIMERRLLEIEKTNFVPDLIIIDWWKGQLSSVVEIVEKYIPHPPLGTSPLQEEDKKVPSPERGGLGWGLQLVWLAKKEEILYKYINWVFEEIILDKDSTELRLVQKIRDEAHRFAITFNRDSRIKSMKKNILESLPWFGIVSRKKILKNFWSVENLVNIEKSELSKFLNKTQIETLENHWLI